MYSDQMGPEEYFTNQDEHAAPWENLMDNNVGLWIDHRRAIVVSINKLVEKTTRIISDMEKHVRFSGAAQKDSAEDQRDRRFTEHLHRYYDKVVSSLRDADAILILGPGEAKLELKLRLEGESPRRHIVAIETADKMTTRQLVARVRQHFLR